MHGEEKTLNGILEDRDGRGMTPEIKILRDALEDIKSSYHESGAGPNHAPCDYSIELCREIASEAIAEADKVSKDFSVDMSGAKVDSEKRTISGIKIRWTP